MSTKAITVTKAARNFADCINRAHYQGTTFVLHKNGVPVARIVPEEHKSCTALELAATLAKVRLTDEEFASWRRDLKIARKILLPPVDKWQS
jgi:antitoxin (DNA-binding transcriptional repressor) of toxin-antitoxin stability system